MTGSTPSNVAEWLCGELSVGVCTLSPPGISASDIPDPFVTLATGQFSRTLLARLARPDGDTVRDLALMIQSDEYPVGELDRWSCDDVERLWEEKWRAWSLGEGVAATPELVDVLPAASRGGPPRFAPTLYCKEKRVFFTAPCPNCGQPLATCRDSDELRRLGLPAFDDSLQRFLRCAECLLAGRETRYYALILTDPAQRQRGAGDSSDLYVSLARLAREGGPLPCFGCDRVDSCYAGEDAKQGDVVRMLTPLSFYDFAGFASTVYPWTYEQFASAIGGAALPDDFVVSHNRREAGPERRFIYQDDPAGKLPLEVLRLKLTLFADLVDAVSSLHRGTKRPHLGLSPESAVVAPGTAGSHLPAFYAFRVRMADVGGAMPLALPGLVHEALALPLLTPSPLRNPLYAPPRPFEAQATAHEGQLQVEAVDVDDSGHAVIRAALASDFLANVALGPFDGVGVSVHQYRPPVVLDFFATARSVVGEEARIASLPLNLEPGALQNVRALVGQPAIRVSFTLHPCLHVPWDLQSLGLILFTTLLANEQNRATAVVSAARKLASTIDHWSTTDPGALPEDIEEHALVEIRRLVDSGMFARRQIFERPAAAEPQIADGLWHGALLIAARALTPVTGFGFCHGHDDFDPDHPEGKADRLRAEIAVLIHQIDVELFGGRARRQVFSEAVRRVRESVEKSGRGWTTGSR